MKFTTVINHVLYLLKRGLSSEIFIDFNLCIKTWGFLQ